MDEDTPPSQAVLAMMTALNWAYDKAASSIPGLGSASDLAESHKRSCGESAEKAIDDLIAWQTGYAGAAGFASNLGGLVTMPISVPANLASVLLIQFRMIAAIAHLRGYKINDEKVRTLAFLCLAGSGGAEIARDFGVALGSKLAAGAISRIPGAILIKINQAVGFRLITKAGTTGLVNLTKIIPVIGGFVGGGFDAVVTRGIGGIAKETFTTLDGGESISDDQAMPKDPTSGQHATECLSHKVLSPLSHL